MGMILPIHKNKGPATDPDNYRRITLLSFLCRVFTSVLTIRLTEYIVELGINIPQWIIYLSLKNY